ncbi:MAG: D-alanine--D-alanine ligase [Propionibacteriaceae bacterium]|nr:D-alanine--D-alanine ligase [Propionibacteriaceae bacterium]
MKSRIPVAIFFGGQSSEHEISCLTAQGVLGALDGNLFEAFGVGIAKDGRWVRYTPQQMMSLGPGDAGLPAVNGDGPEAILTHDATNVYLSSREDDHLVDTVEVNVALPLFHGPYGEDGTIQGFFEMIGLPYVGSGVTASAMGMDKQYMKMAFAAAGLPVAPYLVFREETDDAIAAAIAASPMTYPVYVKPARSGSSVGVSRVATANELPAALAEARRHDPKVLVEQGIEGAREIECAVLGPEQGSKSVRTSRPGEIVVHTADRFYDYRAKYLAADVAEVVVPADLDAETTARVQQVAADAFASIGAEGLARVDSFVLEDGSVVLIEINTMPGFTEISAFPQMWRADGVTYPTLITNLIVQALTRQFGVVR